MKTVEIILTKYKCTYSRYAWENGIL